VFPAVFAFGGDWADAGLWDNAIGKAWLGLDRILAPVMIAIILVRSLGIL